MLRINKRFIVMYRAQTKPKPLIPHTYAADARKSIAAHTYEKTGGGVALPTDAFNQVRRDAELLRVGMVAEGIEAAKFRAEFLKQVDCDVRADLDIASPQALHEGRLVCEIARGIGHVRDDGAAVSAGKLRDVDRLVPVVLVREETHLQRVPRALKSAFAPAIDVSRIGVH